jgi:hypothetical protein
MLVRVLFINKYLVCSLAGFKNVVLIVSLISILAACHSNAALPTMALWPTSQATATEPLSRVLSTADHVQSTASLIPTETASTTPDPLAVSTSTVPTATITNTPTITPTSLPLEIDFERVYPIDLPLRAPLIAALNEDRSALTTHRYTLTAYKTQDGWLKILLVPTSLVEENWQHVETMRDQFVEVVGWQEGGQWHMARVGSKTFYAIQANIPDTIIAREIVIPPLAGEYLFPWAKGQAWWAIQGWHDGYALDFQPVTGQRNNVLASESGWLREICGDGYQSFLEIQHADGRSTFYLHVTLPHRIRALLDHSVQRGQYLGELIGEAHFATDCGRGLSRHLHFVTSDPNLIMNGYVLSDVASTASCCAAPPMYISSNQKQDITQE